MTVEIRELIIRTTIVGNAGNPDSSSAQEGSGGDRAIVAACVAQVLKILERKKER
ncbi:hypothetical protein IQ249_10825 [Lusitaniella coriacea LEGE 07157]|uniref:Uncharacterized protein n=1 Tax=Lusitaniella coriacea LEGE 07157 TaxID=945747 RepID=A0A8J7DWD0_9CYAN|nr:DUF5908 family protein [Lusitaniella coriacea]MBE9116392.1 hypothetical protein [Lusitaniella coriacea LEGE 07157]